MLQAAEIAFSFNDKQYDAGEFIRTGARRPPIMRDNPNFDRAKFEARVDAAKRLRDAGVDVIMSDLSNAEKIKKLDGQQ